jgi:hypothetical protein
MPSRSIVHAWHPVVAQVEWRAERHGEERPAAVVWGGERFAVVAVVEAWVEGTATAGAGLKRAFVVEDHVGQLWRIRVGGTGPEVELAEGSRQLPPSGRG